MTWDFQQCGMCDQQRLRPACTYVQSDQSICKSLVHSMTVKLLTEQHLESLSLKGGWTCSSESTLVKMPHCWISHVVAQMQCLLLSIARYTCFGRCKERITYVLRWRDNSGSWCEQHLHMGHDARKLVFGDLWTTKAQTSLHIRSLISAFNIRVLGSIISNLATSEISIF